MLKLFVSILFFNLLHFSWGYAANYADTGYRSNPLARLYMETPVENYEEQKNEVKDFTKLMTQKLEPAKQFAEANDYDVHNIEVDPNAENEQKQMDPALFELLKKLDEDELKSIIDISAKLIKEEQEYANNMGSTFRARPYKPISLRFRRKSYTRKGVE